MEIYVCKYLCKYWIFYILKDSVNMCNCSVQITCINCPSVKLEQEGQNN